MLHQILLVFAFVLAVLAALDWPKQSFIHLGWAAFAFFIAALLFGGASALR